MKYKIHILWYGLLIWNGITHTTKREIDKRLTESSQASSQRFTGTMDHVKAVCVTALHYATVVFIPTIPVLTGLFKMSRVTTKGPLGSTTKQVYEGPVLFSACFIYPLSTIVGTHRYLLQSRFFHHLTGRLHHNSPWLYYPIAIIGGYAGFITGFCMALRYGLIK